MLEPALTYFKVIGTKPAKPPFRLEVRFMHGDADGYTTDTWEFDSEGKMAQAWRDLKKFNVIAQKYKYETSDAGQAKFFAEANEVMGWEDSRDYYYETYPRDMTYDDVRAQLDSVEAFTVVGGIEYELQLI